MNSEIQRLASNIGAVMHHRALESRVVRLLSDSHEKIVELVEDTDGNRVVRRTYQAGAWGISRSKASFKTSWNNMLRDFGKAGINIVPSFIYSTNNDAIVIASQYLHDARPIIDASTESKVEFAKSLGVLMIQTRDFFPDIQMFMADMAHVTKGQDEKDKIILTDIDPYEAPFSPSTIRNIPRLRDAQYSTYIKTVSRRFYDDWCHGEEKEEVIGAFLNGVVSVFEIDPTLASIMKTAEAFQQAQMLKSGIDLRKFK